MANALIGYSGFVGSTLLRQAVFDCLYRSTNIEEICGRQFDVVVCAGAPAQKWIANREPEEDKKKIHSLIGYLKTIKCSKFILISTVDVFKNPIGVNEDTLIDTSDLHAYGLHRFELEEFVRSSFSDYLIVRLPGLVGPGLKKNIIFDFLNSNNISSVDSRAVFQFYPMVNLWYDIQEALKASLKLIHLTAEPISVADVSLLGFGKKFTNELLNSPAKYDMRSKYAEMNYQYSRKETIQTIRCFAQSEPLTKKVTP